MYAPRALISMLAVLVVFAVVTYVLNGSLATTAWQTALCAVILQAGYFVGLLFLVRRERQARETTPSLRDKEGRLKDELHGGGPSKLNISDR